MYLTTNINIIPNNGKTKNLIHSIIINYLILINNFPLSLIPFQIIIPIII